MPYKDIEKQRAAQRDYARRNQEKNYQYARERKDEIREWFIEIKKDLKCQTCGENHPACLEFHHENEDDKYGCVSSMVHAGYAKEKILAEIKKCSVFCSNCHRKFHFNNGSGNNARIRHVRKNRLKRNFKKFAVV